jgi:hypothetical protein
MRQAILAALATLQPVAIAQGFDWPDENMNDSTTPVLVEFLAEVTAFIQDAVCN